MKLLVDMNLAPAWCGFLAKAGHDPVHWWTVGPANAPDLALMDHAREHGQIVLTHYLDFGAILATTSASGPSVIQIRAPGPSIESCGDMVLTALQQFENELRDGAIVTVTQETARATVLPLQQRKGTAP